VLAQTGEAADTVPVVVIAVAVAEAAKETGSMISANDIPTVSASWLK